MKNIYLFVNVGISQVSLLIQCLHQFKKFCLWTLMITINVSVAICQLPIRQFRSIGKRSVTLGPAAGTLAPRKYMPTTGPSVVPRTLNTICTNVPLMCCIVNPIPKLATPYNRAEIYSKTFHLRSLFWTANCPEH